MVRVTSASFPLLVRCLLFIIVLLVVDGGHEWVLAGLLVEMLIDVAMLLLLLPLVLQLLGVD